MKNYSPYIILFFVIIISGVTYFHDQSYQHLKTLQTDLLSEKQEFDRLNQEVKDLKKLVYDLNSNPVIIEQYARDNYALARPDEQIVFFENGTPKTKLIN